MPPVSFLPSFEALQVFLLHSEVLVLLFGSVAGTAIFIYKYLKQKLKE